ncbi:MAG TPA: bifunctional riboflavin kinase/FAD synthetase [Verrucomicrobiae bacterium]|nr:bifunctional riboflavin kinase/FAD synthetase [Verrucomicrobiae bacterium]
MPGAVAVGVFDGLHIGHRALFERARDRARGNACIAVSFEPHPDVVLAREFRPMAPLTPLPEKRARLARMGVDLHVLAFTRELAALEPEAFVTQYLVAPFAPRWLVVGEDFALGRGRAGTVARLRELGAVHGFEVEAVPLERRDGEPVTSTRIRALLAEGRVAEAARLLGRPYGFTALVVGGDRKGRTLGFPTANLRLHDEQQVPAHGIYAVWARIAGEATWRMGAMSVGVRPTFGGGLRTLEVFLLDFEGDLYGRDLTVEFAAWLRPEQAFPGPEELVRAMRADVDAARAHLTALGAPGD